MFAGKSGFSGHSLTQRRMTVKILIAEDELTTRMLVQVSLENWGYRVESVVNGQQAWLALKRKDAPSIAILDWEMPELDGPEVCRKVKEMGKENSPYIILLTGRDSNNDIVEGFDAGADDYMTKPFNNNELQARVRVAERLVRTQTSLAESVAELKEVLNHLEMVREGVAVCHSCWKIFNGDDGNWYTIEESADDRGDSRFFQVVCPDCSPE
jgi:DNA-binding response OmpR family regulator